MTDTKKHPKESLKVYFSDFWKGFDIHQNAFLSILRKRWNVEIDPNPDLLIFSVFGYDHLNFSCKKLCFSGEPQRPNLVQCDMAVSSHRILHKKHFRLPLWVLYYHNSLAEILNPELSGFENNRPYFCSFIVSNTKPRKRIQFFQKLNAQKKVHSAGRALRNCDISLSKEISSKLRFLSKCDFNIAFENAAIKGYVSEKIIEPLSMGCIPIYWGAPDVSQDVNPECFVHSRDFPDDDSMIQHIILLTENAERLAEIRNAPRFTSAQPDPHDYIPNLLDFIEIGLSSERDYSSKPVHGSLMISKLGEKIRNKIFEANVWYKNKKEGNL